jgi:SAM-dependent methyltransferase
VIDRRARLLGYRDPAHLSGLEIGPSHAPLIPKTAGAVRYVDYALTDELRRNLVSRRVTPDQLVEVDLAWGDNRLKDAVGGTVDYVVASHVIEHAPDMVGWLAEIREVLRPGGLLGLAVPDRRFTFDILRPESTAGEMVEAHLLGYRRPSIRQVFDSFAGTRPAGHAEAWAQDLTRTLKPVPGKLLSAFDKVRDLQRSGRYVDSHCWVFTPASFLALFEAMLALGWLGYRIEAFHPTAEGDLEFHVRLIAEDDRDAIARSLEEAREALADAPAPPEDRR